MDSQRNSQNRLTREMQRSGGRNNNYGMLSSRMTNKILDSGYVGTRIAWVRLKGPVCNIFYIVTYVPHKGRTVTPQNGDTIVQLMQLLQTVKNQNV